MNDASPSGAPPSRRPRWAATWKYLGIVIGALALLVAAAVPAAAAELMRVTLVRHAESEGNASGLIDTKTPGPSLTATGRQQAEAVANELAVNNYDAIYASTMIRTQQTAAPMSQRLGLPVQVLPGLQEIEAGIYEDTPESGAASGYAQIPLAWVFGPAGSRNLGIPGSINGNEFDARFDGALKTMYDNGDRNVVVYSHGGSIMFWTLMNANNLTPDQKLDLLRSHALGNTDSVVIEGNPEDGWTVVQWNGVQLAPEPTLGAEVQLQTRTLSRQLTAAVNQVTAAVATRDPATIVTAAVKASTDAVYSATKYVGAVSNKVSHEVDQLGAKLPAPPSAPNVAVTDAARSDLADKTTNVISSNTRKVTKPAHKVVQTLRELSKAIDKTVLGGGNKVVPATTADATSGTGAGQNTTGATSGSGDTTGNTDNSGTGESGNAAA